MKNMGRKIYKAISVILLITVMIVIFMLSHQNGEESTETSGFVTMLLTAVFGENIPEAIVRTFGHFSEFTALGLLVFNCIYALKTEKKPIISIALSWCYAWTDEIHQIFIPGRAFQLFDLGVDLCGIILGVMLIWMVIILKEKLIKKDIIKKG